MPIVDLGATNVAKTAPRTNRVAATAKISVLIDEIGLDERIVVRGGLVLYIVVSMLMVGIACAARSPGRGARISRVATRVAAITVADARLALNVKRAARGGAPYARTSAHLRPVAASSIES